MRCPPRRGNRFERGPCGGGTVPAVVWLVLLSSVAIAVFGQPLPSLAASLTVGSVMAYLSGREGRSP